MLDASRAMLEPSSARWMARALLDVLLVLWLLIKLPFCVLHDKLAFLWEKEKNIADDVVLVTGASSGIGRLQALAFAARSATLVLWDVDGEGLAKVAQEIKAAGNQKVSTYKIDLTNREAIYATAARVKQEVGVVTILVNNAGIVTGKKLLEAADELIQKTFEVNVICHFWTIKAFLPDMLERNHGHIVTIASMAGHIGAPGLVDYCASKFGAVGLDEALRLEFRKLKKTGLHTTCICPSVIDTGMFDGFNIKYPFLMPVLQPQDVANQIVRAVLTNKPVLMTPAFFNTTDLMRGIMPVRVLDDLGDFLGALDTMDAFKGRPKKQK
eukprot:m.96339 g.96339  ORF g.96339 m.96339 type:complete len:326 (-) comp51324_c0_seq1:92-1069(-)